MNLRKYSRSTLSPVNRLVVSQLEAILNCEKRLQRRYRILLKNPTSKDSQTWAVEAFNLHLQTDRLGRLVDAIDGEYKTQDSNVKSAKAPA